MNYNVAQIQIVNGYQPINGIIVIILTITLNAITIQNMDATGMITGTIQDGIVAMAHHFK